MSLSHSPQIVRSGLIHYFDAANSRSYPGTGTTWTNLVGTTNGTLVGGASFNSANGGVIVLDGVNGYIDIPIDLSTGTYTVIGASRYVSTALGRIFSAKNNNWLMGHWSGTTQNYYAGGWVTVSGSGAFDTNWRTFAATGDSVGDSWSLYVNGLLNTAANNGGTAGPNGFAVGSYQGTAEFSNSHVGVLLIYNRVLTAAEILQNHNALKGRYGL